MTGKLYLCATPIGNLEDITLRVLRILKEVDLIAAEDTRNTIRLLNHFAIKTPLTSYHEHNKIEKAYHLVEKMKEGKQIALVTDAGTPAISDPGEDFVRICYEEGIEVTSLPGAAACITALTMSGQMTRRFSFEAFLPRDKKERGEVLKEMEQDTRTLILYESPHHLRSTLKELYEALGDRSITICRELTKKFEEKEITTLSKSRLEIREAEKKVWENTSIAEHMEVYESQGFDRKAAMKAVAKDRGISKREVYSSLLEETKNL